MLDYATINIQNPQTWIHYIDDSMQPGYYV